MSLINKVLSELEVRGVHTSPKQTEVRAVSSHAKDMWIKPAVVTTLVFGILILTAAYWHGREVVVQEQAQVVSAVLAAPVLVLTDVVPVASDLPASKMSYELATIPLVDSVLENPTEKVSGTPKFSPQSEAPVEEARPNKTVSVGAKLLETKPLSVSSTVAADVPLKQISRTQQAEAEFRKASASQQQGHVVEALAGYEVALALNPQLDMARLALAALLMENKRGGDAERVLQDGLRLKPLHTGFSMSLARVQVERGSIDTALETMHQNLPQAEAKADYQAFYAALLQRQGRHKEAVNHYQIAVQLAPNNGVWLMGFGISLQEVLRLEDAKVAYQKALATQSLNPQLTAFVEQKLKGL